MIHISETVNKVKFKMENFDQRHNQHEVVYERHESKCAYDCMMHESKGIPCCHIICVMWLQHVDSFPVSLICNKWLKDPKSSIISSYKP